MITGRSGCGETTLLNILGGLNQPTSGEVIIDGEMIAGLTEDRLAGLPLEEIDLKTLLTDTVEVAAKVSGELGSDHEG